MVKFWGAYSASIEKLEECWTPLTDLINEIYDALRPDDKGTPRFSLVGLMASTWRTYVYNPLETVI
jgi:hypothetical protein